MKKMMIATLAAASVPMQTVSFQVLMLMFVVVLPLLYLVTTRK